MSGAPQFTGKAAVAISSSAQHYNPDQMGLDIFEDFLPLVEMFGDPGDALQNYCKAIGRMLQPVYDISKDGDNDEPGWSQIFDLKLAKDEWLPWLAQTVGYRVTPRRTGEDVSSWSARERLRTAQRSAHRRGTIARMVEVAQEHLTGLKRVAIQQRTTSAHRLTLYYYSTELTTTHADISAAAQSQKAKGLLLTVTALTGLDWNTLVANQATWNTVTSKFTNWIEVTSNPAKP